MYDEIESNYLSARAALNNRIRELKNIQDANFEYLENREPELNENNEIESEQSATEFANFNPIRMDHTNSNKIGQQVMQQNMWQFPSWKAIENTWGEFDGTLIQWQGFHDRFKSAIHDNEQIPRAFKFQYLQKSLKGRAATALGEWQLSDENYNEAWERLNQLYAREYQTGKELLWKFFDLPRLERANGFMIQKYSNVTHEVLRQLRGLHYPVEHYDLIFVHSIHDKLDPETSKAWELCRNSERPSIDDMLNFLDIQAKALMGVQFVEKRSAMKEKKSNSSNYERKSNLKPISNEKWSKSEEKKPTGAIKCKLCNEAQHWLYRCDKFKKLNVPDRKRIVREHELCNNCLKPFHRSKECFAKACQRCDLKHNSLLCPENPQNKVVTSVHTKGNEISKKNYKNKINERKGAVKKNEIEKEQ